MEQHNSGNRYQPAAGSVRRPSLASASTSSTVPALASASLPTSVQKFMHPNAREPILDHPGYAHALLTPEYDATIIYRSSQDQARAQVQQLNNRSSNAKFHGRMTLVMIFLLVGPFIIGVVLEVLGMHMNAVAGVIILGWIIAILLTPIWIMMGASRRSVARAGRPYEQAPNRNANPYGSTY